MDKKLVSIRLEEESLKNFKKIARQQGITFTELVSKSLFYYTNLINNQISTKNQYSDEKENTTFSQSSDSIIHSELLSELESTLSNKNILNHQDINIELPKQNHKLLKIITQLLKNESKKNLDISNQIEDIKKKLESTNI